MVGRLASLLHVRPEPVEGVQVLFQVVVFVISHGRKLTELQDCRVWGIAIRPVCNTGHVWCADAAEVTSIMMPGCTADISMSRALLSSFIHWTTVVVCSTGATGTSVDTAAPTVGAAMVSLGQGLVLKMMSHNLAKRKAMVYAARHSG